MMCVYCSNDTSVTNSRLQRRSNRVWRRRQCKACKAIFTTHEQIELELALSVSRNGQLEPFEPDRLLAELTNCLHHRNDAYTAPREILATIIKQLLALPNSPVFTPRNISFATAKVLQNFDKPAYLRYQANHPVLFEN